MSSTGQQEELHSHSGWWIPAAFFLAIVALSALLLGWYLRPGLRPVAPSGQSHRIGVTVGGVFFAIPANYIQTAGAGGRMNAITLTALFPSWHGYSSGDAPVFAGNAPDSPVIHLSLRSDSSSLDGPARLRRVYLPHVTDRRGEPGPFALTRYGFTADSGYEGYELFAGETAKGLVLLLCERASVQFASPNCLAVDRPLAANVSFSYRFKRAHLAQWRDISAGAETLVATFRDY